MARVLAGDASARRGEQDSNQENSADAAQLPLRDLFGSLKSGLERSDGLMRKAIPALAIIFLLVLAAYRTSELASDHQTIKTQSENTLSLMASVVASGLSTSGSKPARGGLPHDVKAHSR